MIRVTRHALRSVPVEFSVVRREFRLLGWHFATTYVQELRFNGVASVSRTRWLYAGPKGLGFGFSLPGDDR